jgi:hypothetical protein
LRDAPLRRVLCATAAVAALASACTSAAAHGTPTGAGAASSSTNSSAEANVPNPFTITRRFPASKLGLHHPLNLAVAPDGNLYVTDATPRVVVISPDGTVINQWGTKGNGRGEFDFVPDVNGNLRAPIAVGANGNVYVSDQGNARIEVFSSGGTFIRQFGSSGLQDGQFLNNQSLTVDAGGSVYVADDIEESILQFSPAGHFIRSLQGGDAASDPELRGHFILEDVDLHGRIVAGVDDSHWVVYIDSNNLHKVEAFPTDGLFKNNWGPCDVTVDGLGNTLVQSCPDAGHPVPGIPSYRAALVFDRTHKLVGAWYTTPWSDFAAPKPGPNGDWFALGTDGSIIRMKVALPGA